MAKSSRLCLRIKARGLLRFIRIGSIAFIWLIAIIGFHYLYDWPKKVSIFTFFTLPFIGWYFRNKKFFTICVIIGFLGMIISVGRIVPSNNRDWATEVSVLPRINIADHQVIIQGFRNFRWRSQQKFDPVWVKRSFDLRKLKSLDLIVEPFKDSELMAHTMLRFGFGEGRSLIVSVEARREKHEKFNLVAGALRQFELIYIFGDENDLLPIRVVHRGARLYVYPVKANEKFIVDLFLDLVSSANALQSEPKFYRSIWDNCTTTLVKHIDRQHKEHIGIRYETLFPALTGRLLYRMGYMDTILSEEEAKEHFRVDEFMREENAEGMKKNEERGSPKKRGRVELESCPYAPFHFNFPC